MNEILEKMRTRRSIRKFRSDMLPDNVIDKIIEGGIYAASGRNFQSPIVVAVTDKETRDRLSRVNAEIMGGSGDPFYWAPVVLIVLGYKSRPTCVYDGSIVMGNLMLASHSLGVGSCWIHRSKETFDRPEWKEWLRSVGVEGDYEGIGNCVIGYIDGEYPEEKPRNDGRVFFVK